MDEFVPATFRMDVTAERDEFFSQREGSRNGEATPVGLDPCLDWGLLFLNLQLGVVVAVVGGGAGDGGEGVGL